MPWPICDEVHEWFLHRGLPLVLTRRVRSRALIERSAPVVSGVGAVIALTMMLAELTGGDPDYGYVIRLGVLDAGAGRRPVRAVPAASDAAPRWARRAGGRPRCLVMALFVFGLPFADSGFSGFAAAESFGFAVVALLAVWLTYLGFGSIALWAFRFAMVQFGALGTLMSRALPLLMLTVVVYFTGELWQLAARMTRQRLWQTSDSSPSWQWSSWSPRFATRCVRCATTGPSNTIRPGCWRARRWNPKPGHQPTRTPLSLAEQINVVAVMVVSQAIQVVFFTAGLFAFFLALGIIAIPDDVAVLWSAEETCAVGEPPCAGTWFGVHIPIPQTVVHMSLFVAVLSGLYFTVSTSVDPLYRQRFFDPLVSDVAVSLAGRDAYLERRTAARCPTPCLITRARVCTRHSCPAERSYAKSYAGVSGSRHARSRMCATGTDPGSTRCRWPAMRSTTCR